MTSINRANVSMEGEKIKGFSSEDVPIRGSDGRHDRQDEFVRLLSRDSSRIFGFILSLTANRADAEDIFQDVSVVLWRRFDEFVPETNFRAWACQIAYYQVLNFRRSKKHSCLLSDEAIEALVSSALVFVEGEHRREEALAECLEKLGPEDRRLIEQRYFSQRATKNIAQSEGRSIHSIYRSLNRIHAALLRCVRQSLASESM